MATTDFSVRIAHKRSRLTLATIAVIADWHDSRIQGEIDPPTKAAAAVVDMDGAVEGMKPLDGSAEEGAREGVGLYGTTTLLEMSKGSKILWWLGDDEVEWATRRAGDGATETFYM